MTFLQRLFTPVKIVSTIACSISVSAFSETENAADQWKTAKSIYEFSAKDIDGTEVDLSKYKGKVCIILNVASKCGYTGGHYNDLNKLYAKYHENQGLSILAFPCNQFAFQEPGTNDQIKEFAQSKKVKFDMFSKVNVNGADAHPLFKFLKLNKDGTEGENIRWNFTKFIVDKSGKVVGRYGPNISPEDLEGKLVELFKSE